MKNQLKIKTLIKKICEEDVVLVDHDLNVTVLKDNFRGELNDLIKDFDFVEFNRVLGYFLDELEGSRIEMTNGIMDNPDLYLIFCIDECGLSIEDLQEYINEFKKNNFAGDTDS